MIKTLRKGIGRGNKDERNHFQHSIRVKALNHDRRSRFKISKESQVQTENSVKNEEKVPQKCKMTALNKILGESQLESNRPACLAAPYKQLQLNLDMLSPKQRQPITPKLLWTLRTIREQKSSWSRRSLTPSQLQQAASMRLQFHQAKQKLVALPEFIKHQKSVFNSTSKMSLRLSQRRKSSSPHNFQKELKNYQFHHQQSKERYSDIPIQEFLYQKGRQQQCFSKILQKKLESMRQKSRVIQKRQLVIR